MSARARYALYYIPAPDSALYRFGADLLGYDAFSGTARAFPDSVRHLPDWAALTSQPRLYGLHATLKAPFALAAGAGETALVAACETFARTGRPIPVVTPLVRSIAAFIAIVPAQPCAELAQLARACVVDFDAFRAPLSSADRARRNVDALTPRQAAYLERWGYPYVMEDFRFHLTLTGRVAAERQADLRAMLQEQLAALDCGPMRIDGVALCRQDHAQARFRVLARYPLAAGASVPPTPDPPPDDPENIVRKGRF